MPQLALSMIVKNAGGELVDCLASVRGIVDEIVVVDTGSRDASLEIARKAGARTFTTPWENHFAKARNLSLAHVTADWVLILDADERLDPVARKVLRRHLGRKDLAGYYVTIRNYLLDPELNCWDRTSKPNETNYAPAKKYPFYVDHENVRLFRRDSEIYFTGRVHETVGWRIRENGGRLANAKFCIHHFGLVRNKAALARKVMFYRDLGRQKLAEMPKNAQAHLELGILELENFRNFAGALKLFQRACELNPRFGVAWYFAGKTQFQLGRYADAARSMERAEVAGKSNRMVSELAGDASYHLGRYEAAAGFYRRALKESAGDPQLKFKLGLVKAGCGNAAIGSGRPSSALQQRRLPPHAQRRHLS